MKKKRTKLQRTATKKKNKAPENSNLHLESRRLG
jgi:hypothetical protein